MNIHVFEFVKEFFIRNSVVEPEVVGTKRYIYPKLLEVALRENRMANRRANIS